MLEGILKVEAELERQGQELAVAWRRGRAAYVLNQLSREGPLRAGLLAARIYDLLARWDPMEGQWPVRFWRAMVARSEGWLADEELQELDGKYRRRFGMSPPAQVGKLSRTSNPKELKRSLEDQARKIRQALDQDEPIPRPAFKDSSPVEFMRRRSAIS